ncbi:MAG: class I SAM-dependent methyltransferase [Actinomycetota bacterium]
MDDSVAFDRAAEYYDATRGLTDEGVTRQTELLAEGLRGRGRALEIGVGTGQVALPLHHAGIAVVGMDLSMPMLAKLMEKAGGRSPLPLVQGDATRMPFRDGAFGAAYLRWVLHLIPEWRLTLGEIVRVVEPGGAILVLLGAAGKSTPQAEIQQRFAALAGVSFEPRGLSWGGYDELDAAMTRFDAAPRTLAAFSDTERDGLDVFIDGIAGNRYSWTWRIEDPELLGRVAVDVRGWAEDRFGPLDQVPRAEHQVVWRAYDLPVDR